MYEVDFLPVGDASRSGDAIALRYSAVNPSNDNQVVVVIDGGFDDDGEALVKHIRNWYHTDRVDLMISTHPDGDHAGGLHHVLGDLTVGELLIHDPRRYLPSTTELALDTVIELIDLADQQQITRTEPFTGLTRFDGSLLICGPTREYYRQLLGEQLSAQAERHARTMAKVEWAGLRGITGRPLERLTDAGENHCPQQQQRDLPGPCRRPPVVVHRGRRTARPRPGSRPPRTPRL